MACIVCIRRSQIQPLLDADVLIYEAGFAAESGWDEEGHPPFDYAANQLDTRIANICAMVGATAPPILFLTGKKNFRNDIAKRKKYKDRASNKPYHYKNLTAYIKGKYDFRITEGLEADDLMAIEQTLRPNETIICTRDKDLRSVPGWFYCWELGKQASFGPFLIEGFGNIELVSNRKKIEGWGEKFFYAQCLLGDKVDSIPGLDGCGPVGAFEILEATTTPEEAFKAVLEAYRGSYGDNAEDELLEQGRLLHMTRKLHEDGSPVLWELPI